MSLVIPVPGWGELQIDSILFDLNGTLACDGTIAVSTRERLIALGTQLNLHIMSADTHGTLDRVCEGLPVHAQRVLGELGAPAKLALLEALGPLHTIAVGNGRNDVAMLRAAALGIAILGAEGAAAETLLSGALVFTRIDDALDALLNPKRLVATLRG